MLRTIKGGQAVPLGRGFYYMRGRKHEQGGIDIGRNLEVEDGEITQITPNSIKVFSAQPILNGLSPAQKVLGGDNPNRVFAEQEDFKDRFNLKDDGSKKAEFGLKKTIKSAIKTAIKTSSPLGYIINKLIEPETQNSLLSRTEGIGDITLDGLSVVTSPVRHNRYDGKIHDNTYKGPRYAQNGYTTNNPTNDRNLIRMFTMQDSTGFEPSTIGAGRYIGTEYENLPAIKGKFYGDTLYLPIEDYKRINNISKNVVHLDKDTAVDSEDNKVYDNTDDVRNHTTTLIKNGKKYIARHEDVFDSNNYLIDKINHPFILNQDVPIYFTRDSVKLNKYPYLTNTISKFINDNQTKNEKVMGGLVNIRPFTGARKKSVTIAALGTEDDYLKETINLPEVVVTAPIKGTSSTAGVKPVKPTKRKTSPITTVEDYAERSDNFRIPGIADVGIVSKITKSDVSPIAKPINPALNTRTKNILASNKPTITKSNSFKNINPEEAVGLASNILSSGISYLTNRRAINNMTPPSEPTMRFAPKLNTTVNINPQDDLLREAGFNIRNNITQNTASSNVARNLINASNLSIVNARNQLYSNKFNKETELINQDKLNRQAVADRNIAEYNAYKDRVIDFNNRKADMQGENIIGLINGINSAVQDTIARRQADRALRTNAGISLAAYPNSVKYLLNTVPELRKILKVG